MDSQRKRPASRQVPGAIDVGLPERVAELERTLAVAEARIRAMEASTSWRVTAPLRAVVSAARRLTEGARAAPASRPSTASVVPDSIAPDLKQPVEIKPPANAKAIEDRLWGGFSQSALDDLEAIRATGNGRNAANAGWALACWYTADNAFGKALESLVGDDSGERAESMPRTLLRSYCLVRLGRATEARAVLEPLAAEQSEDPNLCMAMANTCAPAGGEADDDQRLQWINRLYGNAGLALLARADPKRPLTVDNLTVAMNPAPVKDDDAKVSIILPLYGAEETLRFTLDSILAQTWRNLELIIVEDRSPDASYAIAKEYAARDPRIVLLRQDRNRGSYSARNRGIEVATGDFLTIHDANDWSHPQKIEIQARHLLENEQSIANHTCWARVYGDMMFVGKFRRKDKLIDWNPSSFFFRRELLDRVGAWDAVRISADAEFVRRTRRCFPDRLPVSALDSAPLAFGFDTETSLTKTGATHGRTVYHGFRREYHEAANHWHATAPDGQLRLTTTGERRFPAPGAILPDRTVQTSAPKLIIADFNAATEAAALANAAVDAMAGAGDPPAIFNWRDYDSDVTAPLGARLRQMAAEGRIRIIAPGERVEAGEIVIFGPGILRHRIDLFPVEKAERVTVVVDHAPDLSAGPYDPEAVRKTVEELFGTPGEWVATTPEAQAAMRTDPRFPAPADGLWTGPSPRA